MWQRRQTVHSSGTSFVTPATWQVKLGMAPAPLRRPAELGRWTTLGSIVGTCIPKSRTLVTVYLLLSVIGLIATWYYNLQYFVGSGNIEFGPYLQSATINPAATAITVDIYFSVLVFSIWAFRESKRIGMKWPAAYVVLCFGVGLAFAFPLFLAFRERAIMRIGR